MCMRRPKKEKWILIERPLLSRNERKKAQQLKSLNGKRQTWKGKVL